MNIKIEKIKNLKRTQFYFENQLFTRLNILVKGDKSLLALALDNTVRDIMGPESKKSNKFIFITISS